mgnify:CR=1 FL=1
MSYQPHFIRLPITYLTLSYFKAFKKDLFLEIITYTSVWLSTFILPTFAPASVDVDPAVFCWQLLPSAMWL